MAYDLGRDGKSSAGSGGPASRTHMLLFFLILLAFAAAGFIYFYATGSSPSIDTTDLRPPITQPSSGQSRNQ